MLIVRFVFIHSHLYATLFSFYRRQFGSRTIFYCVICFFFMFVFMFVPSSLWDDKPPKRSLSTIFLTFYLPIAGELLLGVRWNDLQMILWQQLVLLGKKNQLHQHYTLQDTVPMFACLQTLKKPMNSKWKLSIYSEVSKIENITHTMCLLVSYEKSTTICVTHA